MATVKATVTTNFKQVRANRFWVWLELSWFLLVFAVSFGLYFVTSAPSLTWHNGGDDGGDLATAANLLGIAHPTGYPLYLLLNQPLILLGIEPVRALSLMSAFCGAVACALLAASVAELINVVYPQNSSKIKNALIGSASGLLLAVSPLFWSQAVIAEVYSFAAALLALTLFTLTRWLSGKNSLLWVIVATGLMAAHHRTGFLTIFAVVLFVVFGVGGWKKTWQLLRQQSWRKLATTIVLFVACFLPYGYLLIRGGANPAANWFDPSWNNLNGFWAEFSGSSYQNLLLAAPFSQSLARIPATLQILLNQFTVVGIILGLVGWWACYSLPNLKPFFWFALVATVLHTLFAAIYAADNSQVYLLPVFLIWSALIGVGLVYIINDVAVEITSLRWIYALLTVFVIGILLWQLFQNYGNVDASQDKTATIWVSATLAHAPKNAVLVTQEDKYTFALWYAQYALNQRPDLKLIDVRLLYADWYRQNLHRLYPNVQLNDYDYETGNVMDWLKRLVASNPNLQVVTISN